MTQQALEGQAGKLCLLTGAGGYLGGAIKRALDQRGLQVIELLRKPRPGSNSRHFELGSGVEAAALAGASALVHCAYDFSPGSWPDIHRVNVSGSENLFRAARDAGVSRIVYVSSISAFEGCRALYGKAKLETEKIARQHGAISVRPGLIWGYPLGGPFGRLVKQVEQARVLPLFGGGGQIQFPVHHDDVAGAIADCASGRISSIGDPITVANEQPWTFRRILEEIARSKGKQVSLLPVPWRAGWAVLKLVELSGLRLAFRSDNLVSLMNQNPNPFFEPQRKLGIVCRPFDLAGRE